MTRDDIKGEPIASSEIREFLRGFGTNPHGEPLYRVIHTSNTYKKQGGAFKIWDESLSLQERGGLVQTESGLLVPSDCRPLRTDVCVKDVLKYVQPGFENKWVLERWIPPEKFGSEEAWPTLPGHPGIPLLGPFPKFGDYRFAGGPTEDQPTLSKLQDAIGMVERQFEEMVGKDLAEMMREEEYRALQEHEAQREKDMAEDTAMFKDALSPWLSTSLGAGRWRNEMAKRAGVKEHAGN